jgi:hypothetical protein
VLLEVVRLRIKMPKYSCDFILFEIDGDACAKIR